jgi:hypothetical protein
MGRLKEDARKLVAQAYLSGLELPEVVELLEGAAEELDRGPVEDKEKR